MAADLRVTSESVAFVTRALQQTDSAFKAGATKELGQLGHLVASDAQALAVTRIPRVTFAWSQMRVGQTPRLVYVVPRKRGTKLRNLKRKNFAPLMKDRAMRPALLKNQPVVFRRFQALTAQIVARFNR